MTKSVPAAVQVLIFFTLLLHSELIVTISSGLLDSPLIYLVVPLVLLLLAVPLVTMFVNTSSSRNARSFNGHGRSSELDDKFGSFEELQQAIDRQLAKYMTALDSDHCMDRIVCELGVKASNIPHKNLFFR